MAERFVAAQTDFGGGQVDEDANRREDAKVPKTGARIMSNWRQRNTGVIDVRPGRNAICFGGPRAERFRMSPTQELIISFTTGAVAILDIAGNILASNSSVNYLWTNATVSQINWCTTPDRIVICFPAMRPQVVIWGGGSTFTFQQFQFLTIGYQINEPFYRPAPSLGITMLYSAYTGAITLTASAAYFTNALIGTIFSFAGNQAQITGVTSPTVASATVLTNVALPLRMYTTIDAFSAWDVTAIYPLGALAETSISKFLMEIGAVNYDGSGVGDGYQWDISFTLLSQNIGSSVTQYDGLVTSWGATRIVARGSAGTSAAGAFLVTGLVFPMITWTQEFMNVNNWPSACFYAASRLGFCDFPQRPDAILWGATGIYDVFWVDSGAALNNPTAGVNADTAILEFLSGQPHVRNVVEWNGDEFIFTDKGIYYVPLATGGASLQPGTIRFTLISDATASTIKPAISRDALVFTSASNDRVSAIIRTGNFTTPYAEQDLTPYHSQLINKPVAMAIGRGDEGFPERYVYVLNIDGSVIVGRMQDDKSFVGWVPWTGAGAVSWLSQGFLDILFATAYGATFIVEDQNAGYFLDHAVNVNTPPANMLSGGHGPFVAFASGTVRVMDGAIDYGTRAVDATGHLLKNPEDDFSSPTIVAGQSFISTYSPFTQEAPLGQDQKQRQRLRRITRAAVSVYNSSGFTFGGRTIPPFDFGDNPFAQPILKETTYRIRPLGRDFDPSITLIKDAPGPLALVEFSLELTV